MAKIHNYDNPESSFFAKAGFRANQSQELFQNLEFENNKFKVVLREGNGEIHAKIDNSGVYSVLKSALFVHPSGEGEVVRHGFSHILPTECFTSYIDKHGVSLFLDGERYDYFFPTHDTDHADEASGDEISANLPGKIAAIDVTIGQLVKAGEVV